MSFWLAQSFDSKSPGCRIHSWDNLNASADANNVERSAINFEDGTTELYDLAWGKPS